MLGILSLIVAIAALVISLSVALQQLKLARHSNVLPIVIDMFREFRSADFKRHQSYVLHYLRQEHVPDKGFMNLPEPAKTHVLTLSHFLDNLAVLVANGIVNEELVISFMGETITDAWSVLEPYIRREEELRKCVYQEYFKDLVVRIRSNPPHVIRRRLNLRKP